MAALERAGVAVRATAAVDVGDKSEGFVIIAVPMVGRQAAGQAGRRDRRDREGPTRTGLINLSHREARRRKAWIAARSLSRTDAIKAS